MMKWNLAVPLFFALFCSACATPQSVAQNFITAMFSGDSDKAAQYLHIANRSDTDEIVFVKEVILPPFMRKFQNLAAQNGGVSEITIDSVHEEDNRAIVSYLVRFENGTTQSDTITLQKDSSWYVLR